MPTPDSTVENRAMSVTIELDFPVTYNGETISTLNMRRPKVRDQRVVNKCNGDELDVDIKMFTILCEVAEAVIDDMAPTDFKKLQDAFSDFLS